MIPKCSIIIPAYNAALFIKETLESLINQTFQDWEVLVINDGSTDDTEKIALSIKDSRIQVITIPNGGVSNARNIGFSKSKGEYVAFLDADDVWLPDNLLKKITQLEQKPEIGLVHSDTEIINEHSQPQGEFKRGKSGDLLDDLLLWNGTCIPAPSSILVRREVIQEVGGFDISLSTAADQEFFFRVAAKYLIGRVPEVTWYYRVHGANMHQNIKHMEEDHIRAYRLAEAHNLFKSRSFKRRCFANLYFILAGSWWVNRNRHPRTFRFLWKSFMQKPSTLPRIIRKLI